MSEKIYEDEEDKATHALKDVVQPRKVRTRRRTRRPAMSNRDVDGAIEWLANQSKNPTQSWKGLCPTHVDRRMGFQPGPQRDASLGCGRYKKYKVECPDYKDKSWWSAIPWCNHL